jgi:hypothetical protein
MSSNEIAKSIEIYKRILLLISNEVGLIKIAVPGKTDMFSRSKILASSGSTSFL